jgi:hypothetical protein
MECAGTAADLERLEQSLKRPQEEARMVHGKGRTAGMLPLLMLVFAFGASSAAQAQPAIGFGGGGSIDPEQGYVSVWYQSRDVAGNFRFRGGVDGGFGGGYRIATFNIDFLYFMPLGQSPWKFVTGGGPALAMTRFADDEVAEFYGVGTEVSGGYSYLFGFAHDAGFFTEFRLGGGNVPSMKFGAGWAIKMQ